MIAHRARVNGGLAESRLCKRSRTDRYADRYHQRAERYSEFPFPAMVLAPNHCDTRRVADVKEKST